MTAAPKTLTLEEFEQLPDKPGKQELLDGELIELPPPEERHSVIAHRLFRLLDRYLETANLSLRVRMETAFKIGSRIVQPDVSVIRSGQPVEKYRQGSPALAVEVISRANRALDVQRKLAWYFEYGSEEVWLIYPLAGVIEVHHREASAKHAASFASELLPGLTIDPAALFQPEE